jgi:hypothetical protein
VRKRETFVDRDNVGNSVSGVENDTRGTTGSVQGQDGLDRDVEGWGVEGLEDDLCHFLSVGLGIDGGFGKKNWVLLRGDTKLIVESVMPDFLHIIPVGDNTVFNGVSQCENTTLRLCLIADIGVLLTHSNHDTMMARTANNGWENSSRSIITGETGLAHTGAIVNDESLDLRHV